MTANAANSIRSAVTLPVVQWVKMRVLGGPQYTAMISALQTAVFFGLSYVGMTMVTGWAQQMMAAFGLAERR